MKFDLKTLLIGLLLGICVTLSMGQRAAPAQKLDADYRYQISVVSGANGGFTVFTLDHETKKVYSRSIDAPGSVGVEVKWLIAP